jgi:hypothetical protein
MQKKEKEQIPKPIVSVLDMSSMDTTEMFMTRMYL